MTSNTCTKNLPNMESIVICKQNNQLPTKGHDELEDNSIILLSSKPFLLTISLST